MIIPWSSFIHGLEYNFTLSNTISSSNFAKIKLISLDCSATIVWPRIPNNASQLGNEFNRQTATVEYIAVARASSFFIDKCITLPGLSQTDLLCFVPPVLYLLWIYDFVQQHGSLLTSNPWVYEKIRLVACLFFFSSSSSSERILKPLHTLVITLCYMFRQA